MIVEYFKALAAKYNADQKCGFCWVFGSPLSESGLNRQLGEEDTACCINMILTDYRISQIIQTNNITGLTTSEHCDHRFVLYVVQQRDDIGQNVFNEIPGHEIESSLWEQLYKPLLNCLGCDKNLYECQLGFDFQVLGWDLDKVQFKEDRNLTGWKISGRFRVPNLNTYINTPPIIPPLL